jgi:hypothetical protein
MKKSWLLNTLCVLFLFLSTSFSTSITNSGSEKVVVTTDPQTARIYINGVLTGTGKVVVTVPKNDCVKVEVKLEGYIQETRTYCDKKGISSPPKSDYIQLQEDESYTSSSQSDIANKEMLLSVKKGKTREDTWKTVVSTILNYFDALENNDEKSGYLRTSWVGQTFRSNTIRTRVIIKQSSEDPLTFKMKFVSEESGRSGTAFNADEQFRPFTRILKKYDGFYDELSTKLAN